MLSLFLSALLLQPAPPPPADEHHPTAAACSSGVDQGLPPNLDPWRSPVAPGETLRLGHAVNETASTPLILEIERTGTYGIAIAQGAWIDVARDGAPLRSVAHRHGPSCSTIRKIVEFALAPGRYTITLSRTQGPNVRLLVVRR